MNALRLALGVAGVIATAAFPTAATAQKVEPPGNSAVNQYTETFPSPGGGTPTTDKGKRSPDRVLGVRNTRRLQALGPEGKAAAALAAATAPGKTASQPGGPGGRAHGFQASDPGSSSGLSEVIRQATGSSSSGKMGPLLPLAIVAALAASLVYLWRRGRRTA
jgi:hypothetical protein